MFEAVSGKRLPVSLATALAALAIQAHPLPAAAKPSPFEIHDLARSRVSGGRNATLQILDWVAQTGDHSFDGLIGCSEAKKRGLHLQLAALDHWDKGDLAQAQDLYQEASRLMARSGAATEAAFCLYYIAEILAEQDRHSASLDLLREAEQMAAADGSAKPYLEALILQSRGYALWVLDHLQGSAAAFGLAQQRWGRLSVPHGEAMTWNNLAGLYEDMGLRGRADHAYRRAVESAGREVFPEIRSQILANYAFFLHQNGDADGSRDFFEQARRLREFAPFEFLLLRCRLTPSRDCLRELEEQIAPGMMEEIERLLVLAQNAASVKDAERLFGQALLLSGVKGQRRMARLAALQTAKWLETQGRILEAAGVYRKALEKQEFLRRPETIFPYSRAASPLFDGWIRSLIRLGEPYFAFLQIREFADQRKRRAVHFLRGLTDEAIQAPNGSESSDGLDAFVEAARLEARLAPQTHGPEPTPAGAVRPVGLCIVHMWPDGDRAYAWVENSQGIHFRILEIGQPLAELISGSVGALYTAGDLLPPSNLAGLRILHQRLFAPLRRLLDRDRIVFVGHKELQLLPIEALVDETGRWLLLDFSVSYLPSKSFRRVEIPKSATPAVLIPRNGLAAEERFFKAAFPETRFIRGVSRPLPDRARWIHVSSHFTLNADLWLGSSFEGDGERLPVTRFLNRSFACGLLSLGVCDVGNAYGWASPYWLNLAELLLSRNVGALVINRWKMDDLASEVFIDFFRRCRRGLAMDRALTQARRKFIQQRLRRDGMEASAQHPFFWAGISYVGVPGTRLYETQTTAGALLWLLLSAVAVFIAVVRAVFLFSILRVGGNPERKIHRTTWPAD